MINSFLPGTFQIADEFPIFTGISQRMPLADIVNEIDRLKAELDRIVNRNLRNTEQE